VPHAPRTHTVQGKEQRQKGMASAFSHSSTRVGAQVGWGAAPAQSASASIGRSWSSAAAATCAPSPQSAHRQARLSAKGISLNESDDDDFDHAPSRARAQSVFPRQSAFPRPVPKVCQCVRCNDPLLAPPPLFRALCITVTLLR
jgi:hypothetical protein